MSTRWGFGDTLGPGGCERPFEQLSARTREVLDDEIVCRLRAAQARAVALLRGHERELTALTEALLERDTLSAREVDELLAKPAKELPRATRPSWSAQLAAALGAKDAAPTA